MAEWYVFVGLGIILVATLLLLRSINKAIKNLEQR